MEKERLEEMLELLWTLREGGQEALSVALQRSKDPNARDVVGALAEKKLVSVEDDKVALTPDGDRTAREIVRRCRLAETLLAQVLDLEDREVRASACKFEHVLSPRVTERICTFLGHPPVCPHGKPVPRGACCARAETKLEPLVVRLADVPVGADTIVVFVAPSVHQTLDRLSGFGIVPGSTLRLHQKKPSYVVQAGETTVALDTEIARQIYVKKA